MLHRSFFRILLRRWLLRELLKLLWGVLRGLQWEALRATTLVYQVIDFRLPLLLLFHQLPLRLTLLQGANLHSGPRWLRVGACGVDLLGLRQGLCLLLVVLRTSLRRQHLFRSTRGIHSSFAEFQILGSSEILRGLIAEVMVVYRGSPVEIGC